VVSYGLKNGKNLDSKPDTIARPALCVDLVRIKYESNFFPWCSVEAWRRGC